VTQGVAAVYFWTVPRRSLAPFWLGSASASGDPGGGWVLWGGCPTWRPAWVGGVAGRRKRKLPNCRRGSLGRRRRRPRQRRARRPRRRLRRLRHLQRMCPCRRPSAPRHGASGAAPAGPVGGRRSPPPRPLPRRGRQDPRRLPATRPTRQAQVLPVAVAATPKAPPPKHARCVCLSMGMETSSAPSPACIPSTRSASTRGFAARAAVRCACTGWTGRLGNRCGGMGTAWTVHGGRVPLMCMDGGLVRSAEGRLTPRPARRAEQGGDVAC